MLKTISFAVALFALATSALGQEKNVTVADFAGTWNIEAISHQIALVIEPADGNHVTATMMMMGRDTALKGELKGGTLSLVGVKLEGGTPSAPSAPEHGPQAAMPKPILITLQEDGTIAGEMMTNQGPVKWTGEKLKTKKKS